MSSVTRNLSGFNNWPVFSDFGTVSTLISVLTPGTAGSAIESLRSLADGLWNISHYNNY